MMRQFRIRSRVPWLWTWSINLLPFYCMKTAVLLYHNSHKIGAVTRYSRRASSASLGNRFASWGCQRIKRPCLHHQALTKLTSVAEVGILSLWIFITKLTSAYLLPKVALLESWIFIRLLPSWHQQPKWPCLHSGKSIFIESLGSYQVNISCQSGLAYIVAIQY